jgi:hypothetical protein
MKSITLSFLFLLLGCHSTTPSAGILVTPVSEQSFETCVHSFSDVAEVFVNQTYTLDLEYACIGPLESHPTPHENYARILFMRNRAPESPPPWNPNLLSFEENCYPGLRSITTNCANDITVERWECHGLTRARGNEEASISVLFNCGTQ